MKTCQERITEILRANFPGDHLEIINESRFHSRPGNETHFKIILVSDKFNDLNKVKRQQLLNGHLKDIFQEVHSISYSLFSPAEWSASGGQSADSPRCSGAKANTH